MIFNTITFFLFLVLVVTIYWNLPKVSWRLPFLFAANFFFYGWWNWKLTSLLLAVILLTFWGALAIEAEKRKSRMDQEGKEAPELRNRKTTFFLWLTCTLLLGILGYFKYTNFFLSSLKGVIEYFGGKVGWQTLSIILPAGISFYIFQAISYLVTVYRGELKAEKKLVPLGVYLSFFPHLVAGPIIHAKTFLPQLRNQQLFNAQEFVEGARLFALGFLYKSVFADNLAEPVNAIFEGLHQHTPLTILGACLGFYGQIYFDFAGYSLMARGTAHLLGYTIPKNFCYPYRSLSLIEFWRRWHISLSTWLRDYLYIPLGGNRAGRLLQYRNILITMFLGGLWHGASWNFLIWGGTHGLALCANHLWRGFQEKNSFTLPAWGKILLLPTAWLLTQAVVFLCWIPFRAATLPDTFFILKQLMKCLISPMSQKVSFAHFPWLLALLPLLFDTTILGNLEEKTAFLKRYFSSNTLLYAAIFLSFLIGLLFMHAGVVHFIYFQF